MCPGYLNAHVKPLRKEPKESHSTSIFIGPSGVIAASRTKPEISSPRNVVGDTKFDEPTDANYYAKVECILAKRKYLCCRFEYISEKE